MNNRSTEYGDRESDAALSVDSRAWPALRKAAPGSVEVAESSGTVAPDVSATRLVAQPPNANEDERPRSTVRMLRTAPTAAAVSPTVVVPRHAPLPSFASLPPSEATRRASGRHAKLAMFAVGVLVGIIAGSCLVHWAM